MSTSESKPMIVGQVSGVFGVHGWVKIFSHTEPRDNILQYNPWLLKTKEGWQSVSFIKGRKQGKTIVAQLKGVDDRDKAHALIGSDIAINESQLKALDKNDFYWRDLEGLQVINADNKPLGTVAYMMATGANDVIVVKLNAEMINATEEKEMLIPYLMDSVVKNIDLTKGFIQVDWDLNDD